MSERPLSSGESKNKLLWVGWLLFLLVLTGVYFNHFDNGFYFDDAHSITGNGWIRDIRNIPRFFTSGEYASSLPANQAYRPIVVTLDTIDYWIGGGLNPVVYHIHIFFWYIVQLILMFFFFRKVFNQANTHPWNDYIAFFSTAFYGLHTANAETINYISARSDSFSTMLIVASFVLYQWQTGRKYFLYLLTMILAIYTKQTGVMFAPLLMVYVWLFETLPDRKSLQPAVIIRSVAQAIYKTLPVWVIAFGLYVINTHFFTPEYKPLYNTGTSRWHYLITQFHVISHYLHNFILPTKLSADPDFQIITKFTDPRVLTGLIIILSLLAVAIGTAFRKRLRPIAFGIFWFFIALAPTSSIIPLWQIANDHRTFFPYMGLVMALGWLVSRFLFASEDNIKGKPWLKRLLLAVTFLILGGHAYGVYQRNEVWDSSESLWYDVTLKSPNNGRGLMNYGLTLMQKGEYERALKYFKKTEQLMPTWPYIHINLAIAYNALGKKALAEKYYRNALIYGPDNPEAYYYYALWLYQQGRTKDALQFLRKGKEISPAHIKINEMLSILEKTGATIQATDNPDEIRSYEYWINKSLDYYYAGMYEEMIKACDKALELNPQSAEAYNNKCSAYIKLGRYEEAIENCEKALQLRPGWDRAVNNLNWAKMQSGR